MTKASRMLRHARRRAGLTQRQLAAQTGIPQETIARIEAGRVDPRVGTLDRLLEECGFGLEHLPRLGIGIDRTQIRELLAVPPDRRLDIAIESDELEILGALREQIDTGARLPRGRLWR